MIVARKIALVLAGIWAIVGLYSAAFGYDHHELGEVAWSFGPMIVITWLRWQWPPKPPRVVITKIPD